MVNIKDKSVRDILGLDDPEPRNTEKYKGVMTFDHKTGGSIQVMTADSYKRNKKYYVPRKGCRSVMKRF
tara:strand:- start:26 stop:232 length:207 start_codon:yes stop_codon:yes gene_type:complete